MHVAPGGIQDRGGEWILLALVNLLRDERFARFPQDPLLNHLSAGGIVADFHAGRESVDIFREDVVEEGRSAFDGVRHFHPVAHAGQDPIGEGALDPDVLRRVKRMPFGIHEIEHVDVGCVGSRLWTAEGPVAFRPGRKMGHCYGPHVRRDGRVVQHSSGDKRLLCHETRIAALESGAGLPLFF